MSDVDVFGMEISTVEAIFVDFVPSFKVQFAEGLI